MSGDSQKEVEGWKEQTGVRDDTGRVVAYPPTHVKQRWEEKSGSQSLSSWIQDQVAIAQATKSEDQMQEDSEKEELKEEVSRLEDELAEARSQPSETGGAGIVSDQELLAVLSENQGLSVDEVVRELLESDRVNIASTVERQLYGLAEQGDAKYLRTNPRGWVATSNGGEQ
jgi:hypothetical protein